MNKVIKSKFYGRSIAQVYSPNTGWVNSDAVINETNMLELERQGVSHIFIMPTLPVRSAAYDSTPSGDYKLSELIKSN